MEQAVSPLLTVYYDGLCKVCAHEIAMYRRRDRAARVRWVDIMAPDFSPQNHGLDPERIHLEMHARRADGGLAVGVEAFVEIWKVIPGFSPLARLASQAWMKPVLRAGYRAFTRIRPFLPRSEPCDTGTCAPKL